MFALHLRLVTLLLCMSDSQTVRNDILLTMYKSVERQNQHVALGNHNGAEAEKWLQVNLRHNFNDISQKES